MVTGEKVLDRREAEIVRQWFDAVQDLNPAFLEAADYELAKLLYEATGMRVPNSIETMVLRKPE